MQTNTIVKLLTCFIILLLACYQYNTMESFGVENNQSTNTESINESTNESENNVIVDPNIINDIAISEYKTEDSGVTITWPRPKKVMDYMAIIKDKEGSDEIKLFFKDNSGSECDDEKCTYTFQNLINNHKYSIAIAGVTKNGIGNISKEVNFTPTYQTMQCNANGTCAIVASAIPNSIQGKIDRITANDDVTKGVLAKCQNILEKNEGIHDINKIYDASGQFKQVKDILQYPEHLLLPIEKGPNSLAELVKHQLDLGIVNLNIHNQDMMTTTTSKI